MKVSDQGLAFLAAHEGFVSRGYLDPAGIVTIGYGFTMRSRIFSSWWKARHGKTLKVGDRLPRDQANKLLLKLLDEEYAPPVRRRFTNLTQAQFDACVSVVYNLGARALSWRWAKALSSGAVSTAADLLKTTGTTAGGRRLAGLIKRRAAEARLLETGTYGSLTVVAPLLPKDDICRLQSQLTQLGFKPGPIDGIFGKRTRAAVVAFQRANPPLSMDGKPGAATQAALEREISLQRGTGLVGGFSLLTGVGISMEDVSLPVIVLSAVSVCAAGVALLLVWRFRGALLDVLKTRFGWI